MRKADAQPTHPPGRSPHQWFIGIGLFLGTILLALVANQIRFVLWLEPLQNLVFHLEDQYQTWMDAQGTDNPLMLWVFAFGGGLIASISPCILCMLPVNLSYIGTRELTSRREAIAQAGLFVLGVVTTLSLLGLFSSFAGAVMVQYRGYINVVVGTVIVVMGLNLLGLLHLPLPQARLPIPAGAYGFGLTFALVSSPCASPVMFAVLAAAATTGSVAISVVTMVCYALGYTTVIFWASLFAGLVTQTKSLLRYSSRLMQIGGSLMLLIGVYYVISGATWISQI